MRARRPLVITASVLLAGLIVWGLSVWTLRPRTEDYLARPRALLEALATIERTAEEATVVAGRLDARSQRRIAAVVDQFRVADDLADLAHLCSILGSGDFVFDYAHALCMDRLVARTDPDAVSALRGMLRWSHGEQTVGVHERLWEQSHRMKPAPREPASDPQPPGRISPRPR